MSNSPLVNFTKISPNRYVPRNHKIDTVTIHCVSGQCSIEVLGNIFSNPKNQASSTYGIGPDGRIGMYVEEKDGAWTSSNKANDMRAITIEVASDNFHPYKVKDAAYESLINLLVDICQRNGIKKLLWRNDKSLIGNIDMQNMTLHRWFARKACPGDYLFFKHTEIADTVNKRLGIDKIVSIVESPKIESDTDNEKIIWNFFKAKGLNNFAIAGLMGNLYAESGFKPNNIQNSFENRYGSDSTYTSNVDNGSYTNFARDGAGYGLAQWTYWSRKQNLYNYAKSKNKSIGDLSMQLEFLWEELQGYTGVINTLRNANTIKSASDVVLTQFERPADQSSTVRERRAKYGLDIYQRQTSTKTQIIDTEPQNKTYVVRVRVGALNIRKHPTIASSITGVIRDRGIYTIVQESTGLGASKWLKLKSGVGWISSDYVLKV